jgi:ABC-type cobalamin/Fe3+-siderophores transport system ATPase subunit
MSGGAAMRISGLDAGYGGAFSLRGLHFSPAAGSLTVLAGPNGCG